MKITVNKTAAKDLTKAYFASFEHGLDALSIAGLAEKSANMLEDTTEGKEYDVVEELQVGVEDSEELITAYKIVDDAKDDLYVPEFLVDVVA